MKTKIVIVAVALLLIAMSFSNPSLGKFKEFMGETSDGNYELVYRRVHNYLIYSEYELSYYKIAKRDKWDRKIYLDKIQGKYKGMCFNFWR